MTERDKIISEINAAIREGVNQLADIVLDAEANKWAVDLNYYPRDLVNATYLINHVACNMGIKCGHINIENASEFGKRLRELILEMTGYDPADIVSH